TILEVPAVFVASPDHPLANERGIALERQAQFRCGGSQSPQSSNARVTGFESDNLGWYTASHYEILMPLVLSGDLLLLAPTFVAQPYLEAGEVVILDLRWRRIVQVHFAATRAASYSPIVREIREHARAICSQLADDWAGVATRFAAE